MFTVLILHTLLGSNFLSMARTIYMKIYLQENKCQQVLTWEKECFRGFVLFETLKNSNMSYLEKQKAFPLNSPCALNIFNIDFLKKTERLS